MDNPGLPVVIGPYFLKATPYLASGEEGMTLEINFQITEGETVVTFQPEGLSEEAIAFLRGRENNLRLQLTELSGDATLGRTPAFRKTQALVDFNGTSEELNARYADTIKTLVQNAARARTGSQRHNDLLHLMALSTEFYMDRQVALNPAELSPAALETLQNTLPGIRDAGVDVKALKTGWKGNDLKKALSAPAADSFNKLLK
jgi:hypothetical protein